MKILCKDADVIKHGKVNLPDVGTVEVPSDGIIEVDEELGKHLIENVPNSWKKHHFQPAKQGKDAIKAKPAEKASTVKTVNKKIVNAPEPDNLDNETDDEGNFIPEVDENDDNAKELAEQRIELLKKDINALQDITAGLELPQEEWQDLKKFALVNYILDKSKDED